MKKLIGIMGIILSLLFCNENVLATDGNYKESYGLVLDKADLLSETEEFELMRVFDEDAKLHGYDIALVTTRTLGGADPYDVSHAYIDEYELGYTNKNGAVLLLINIGERDWQIAGYGPMARIITNSKIQDIGYVMLDDLSAGNYYEASVLFANTAEEIFEGKSFVFIIRMIEDHPIAVLIAFVFIVLMTIFIPKSFRSKMQNITENDYARDYIVENSGKILSRSDVFSHKTVHRTAKSNSSSGGGGGRSSGGGSRSGGGGKF